VSDEDRRRQRREIRFIQNESAWLQKALFALNKADVARDKQEETMGRDPTPYTLTVGDERVDLEAIVDALEARARSLLSEVKARRQVLR
jgi:hypothetical protein